MEHNKWHKAAYPFEFLQIMMDAEEKIHLRNGETRKEIEVKPYGKNSKGRVIVYSPQVKRSVQVFVGKLWKCTMARRPYINASDDARKFLDSIAYRTLQSITDEELSKATFASKIQLLKFWFGLQTGRSMEEKQVEDDSLHGYSEDEYKKLADSLDEFYVVKQEV